jgi:hypothetical protein
MSKALLEGLPRRLTPEKPFVEQPPYLFRSDACKRGRRFDVKEISPHRLLLATDQGDVQVAMTHITRHKICRAVDRYKIDDEETFMRTMQLVIFGRGFRDRLDWEFEPKKEG